MSTTEVEDAEAILAAEARVQESFTAAAHSIGKSFAGVAASPHRLAAALPRQARFPRSKKRRIRKKWNYEAKGSPS